MSSWAGWAVHWTRGAIRDWRHGRALVPEVGSGDDGSGQPALGDTQHSARAHHRHAYGADGGPRAAREHRYYGRKQEYH